MKRFSLQVIGKVQGVFYRDSTEKKANSLFLKGFVRNEPNGNVYIEAQGSKAQLNEFVKWCKEGPERARVDEIILNELSPIEEKTFRITR